MTTPGAERGMGKKDVCEAMGFIGVGLDVCN
jgi:hypothetical protein